MTIPGPQNCNGYSFDELLLRAHKDRAFHGNDWPGTPLAAWPEDRKPELDAAVAAGVVELVRQPARAPDGMATEVPMMLTYIVPVEREVGLGNVRRFLDLSTGHLPQHLGTSGLNGVDGVTAYEMPYGWLMYVPEEPVGSAADDEEGVPEVVLNIQIKARALGCDYVLFDADGPHVDDLPRWEW